LATEACDGGLHPAPQLQGGGGFPSQEPEGVTDCELAWVLGAQLRVGQNQLKGDVYESGQPIRLVLVLLQPETEALQQSVSCWCAGLVANLAWKENTKSISRHVIKFTLVCWACCCVGMEGKYPQHPKACQHIHIGTLGLLLLWHERYTPIASQGMSLHSY